MVTFALTLFLITILGSITRIQAACDENEFACNSGQCIDYFYLCDGEKNCQDGSDETKSVCLKTQIVCPPFAFKCSYGACVDGDKKCDGKQDCADNSDEKNSDCGTPVTPLSNSNNCPEGSFSCDSGQCISEYEVCDGTPHCRDSSDESASKCVNFPCPPITGFQCSYGGCIDKDNQCDGKKDCRDGSDEQNCNTQYPGVPTSSNPTSAPPTASLTNGCLLPRQPEGGKFKVSNCENDFVSDKCRKIPNTTVPEYTSLEYECIPGFALADQYNNVRYCIKSMWVPQPLQTCLELCPGLTSTTVDIFCTYLGQTVNCSKQMLPRTIARLKCKNNFSLDGPSSSNELVCQNNGRWSDAPFRCKADCGKQTSGNIKPLVSHGTKTSAVEYPWHTGLYKEDSNINAFELFCGGSIITPFLILTAAHCVVDSNTKRQISASAIKIAVGKTTRSWSVRDPDEQRLDVTKIYVHGDYQGQDNYYAFDAAILEIKGVIMITRTSMPVCLEFLPQWTTIKENTEGTAVGWGRNENSQLTENLMSVNLKYVSEMTCKKAYATTSFKNFITHDKFCGLYRNGAGVQQGDSGGGFVFVKPENKLFYIRGIVSTKPKDKNEFATFTNISAQSVNRFIQDIRLETYERHQ